MKIFYFTATGNSLHVAKNIGGELYSIPQMIKNKQDTFKDDAIGFVFPCYAFGLPRIVMNFIQKSHFEANYFFAIMTYGNMAGAGLRHVEEVGGEVGISFNYTNEVLMVDNYLPMFEIEKQLKTENNKEIEKNISSIVQDINSRQNKRITKGLGTTLLSKVVYRVIGGKLYDSSDKKYWVDDRCNGCKICEKVCPADNIHVTEKPELAHKCEGCYACIHHCPQNAIHLKSEKSTARFINAHVELKEIIEANNQK